jgi:hypothetical protein
MLATSHASSMNPRWAFGSSWRGSACRHGDARQVKPTCRLRICCCRYENRATPRSVHRKRDGRQPGNVKPECHQIALYQENLLLPEPL